MSDARPSPALLPRTDRLLGTVAALLLAGMVLLTCVDVVGRYLLDRPLPGALELTELAMGALVFSSLPLVTLRRQHVRVDLFDGLVPRAWRRGQDALAGLVAAACTGVVAWRLWLKAHDLMQAGETTATLHVPVYPLAFGMAVLAFVAAAVTAAMALSDLTAPGHEAPEGTP